MLALPGLSAHSQTEKVPGQVKGTHGQVKQTAETQEELDIRDILIALEQSLNAKNADKVAELFAETGLFIDQSGEETSGRAALQARFAEFFKKESAPVLGLHPDKVIFPASNVALVTGVVSRRNEQLDLPETRFSMLLVRQGKKWFINEVTETVLQITQAESRLQDLSWLIGDWQVDKGDASAKMNVEWAPGKKFIVSKCTLNKKGAEEQVDKQVIGWNPQNNNIVSWHFDSNGGFGSGTWIYKSNEKRWITDVVGIGADGSNTRASNVFTQKSADEFVWQSINRSLDGVEVSDTEALTVHRAQAAESGKSK